MSVCVSVVVPTHNRPAYLDRCLAALLNQDMHPSSYEIIVADDMQSCTTRCQVGRWSARAGCYGPSIRYVPVARPGPAAARNAGWQVARGEIIAFTDDDCIPDPCWLRHGRDAFTEETVGVCGRIIVPCGPRRTDYERNTALLEHAQFVCANCFYWRAALDAVGGFDERFTMAWREDTDLHFTLLKHGYRLGSAPQAIVTHPVRPAPWGISLQQQQKSLFNALLYKKHRALYREQVQCRPPLLYYGAVCALLACMLSVTRRHKPAVATSLAVWLALTSCFAGRRIRDTHRTPRHICEMLVTSIFIPPLAVYWRLRGAIRFRVLFL